MIKFGQMVFKGVNWLHNGKLGQMVLKGVTWNTQCKNQVKCLLKGVNWVNNA